jgi:mRNA interferase MazF
VTPLRGEVWDVQFPAPVGPRPAVVLTTNTLISRLGAVTVAEVTGTAGPETTHVEVSPEVGLTGRSRSWVNTTGLHTVARGRLRHRRGRLAPPELDRVGAAIRLYLDIELD